MKFWPQKPKHYYIIGLFFLVCAFAFRFYIEKQRVLSESVQSWNRSGIADCAVVLTGGAHRIREGFDLLNQKQIKKLIISGVYSGALLTEIFPYWSFYENIDELDVILEKRSLTTFGNAQQSLPIVDAIKCRDVLLITSSVHMYRAFKTFKSTFPDQINVYRHSVVPGPNEGSVMSVGFEILKSVFYSTWAY